MQASGDSHRLADLVDKGHPRLSERKQCELLGVARSSVDYKPVEEDAEEVRLRRILDELYLIDPCVGSRRLVTLLGRDYGIEANRKRIRRVRNEMGLETIYCRPRTSIPEKGHRKYPYLLKELIIECPDQVWCGDITYVPMGRGHAYLCAVMDWYSRKVLGWELSNTMDVALCLKALEKALKSSGKAPGIFNTDQGSQFTSEEWLEALESRGIRVSMDGKGRWMDNVFVERLWRSVKYESIYLNSYADLWEQEAALKKWFVRYNNWRPHQTFENLTPATVYENKVFPLEDEKRVA